jgi:hypothetical protein
MKRKKKQGVTKSSGDEAQKNPVVMLSLRFIVISPLQDLFIKEVKTYICSYLFFFSVEHSKENIVAWGYVELTLAVLFTFTVLIISCYPVAFYF